MFSLINYIYWLDNKKSLAYAPTLQNKIFLRNTNSMGTCLKTDCIVARSFIYIKIDVLRSQKKKTLKLQSSKTRDSRVTDGCERTVI